MVLPNVESSRRTPDTSNQQRGTKMRNTKTSNERKSALLRSALIIAFMNMVMLIANGQGPVSSQGLLSAGRPLSQPVGLDDSRDVINLSTNLVSVAVTVTDRNGQAIAGLRKEDFRVYDDKVEQPISYFSDEDAPASIGIIFDTSGSMSGDAFERAKEALTRFIQTSHPRDEYFLIGISSTPQLLLDRTRDGKAVLDKFTYAQPHGNTAIYDAVYLGVERLTHATYPRRAIILISDGEENNSRYSFRKLRQELDESGVVVYTLRVGALPLPKSISWMIMDPLASISGGKAYWPRSSERMDEAFEQIALDLRRQYSIGYLPANFAADGRRHKLKVVLAAPREQAQQIVVRYREGYYAVATFTAPHD